MRFLPAVLAVAAASPALPALAPAATISVDTEADAAAGDGRCSLREAIAAANADASSDACPAGAGADVIALPPGYYSLSVTGPSEDANATGDLDVASDVAIEGTSPRARRSAARAPTACSTSWPGRRCRCAR